eukprot:254811-Chlamydomonas_euryale.AAC.1
MAAARAAAALGSPPKRDSTPGPSMCCKLGIPPAASASCRPHGCSMLAALPAPAPPRPWCWCCISAAAATAAACACASAAAASVEERSTRGPLAGSGLFERDRLSCCCD